MPSLPKNPRRRRPHLHHQALSLLPNLHIGRVDFLTSPSVRSGLLVPPFFLSNLTVAGDRGTERVSPDILWCFSTIDHQPPPVNRSILILLTSHTVAELPSSEFSPSGTPTPHLSSLETLASLGRQALGLHDPEPRASRVLASELPSPTLSPPELPSSELSPPELPSSELSPPELPSPELSPSELPPLHSQITAPELNRLNVGFCRHRDLTWILIQFWSSDLVVYRWEFRR